MSVFENKSTNSNMTVEQSINKGGENMITQKEASYIHFKCALDNLNDLVDHKVTDPHALMKAVRLVSEASDAYRRADWEEKMCALKGITLYAKE